MLAASHPAALIQALHMNWQPRSSSRVAAAARTCAAASHHSSVRQPGPQRRPAAPRAVEVSQASNAAVGKGRLDAAPAGGSGGGNPAWRRLGASLEQGRPDAALREFLQLLESGATPPAADCQRLIIALCKARRFRDARRAYVAATGAGRALGYSCYHALITAALQAGDVEAALDTYRSLQSEGGHRPNVVTACSMISALGRARRRGTRYAQIAHELWGELSASGAALDAAAYRAGIKACVDAGKLKEADRLLQRMAGAGAQPDARAYNALLAGHARGGNTVAMARLLQKMSAAGVDPSAVTFNTVIDGHVRAGDLAGAQAASERAVAAGITLDAWTYSTLMKGHVQAGQLAAAEAVLGAMAAAGLRPSCVAYTTLIDGHVRRGDMDAARRLLQAMQAAGEPPNAVTFSAMLRGYADQAAQAARQQQQQQSKQRQQQQQQQMDQQPEGQQQPEQQAEQQADAGSAPASAGAGSSAPLAAAQALLEDMAAAGVPPSVEVFNTLMSAAVAAGEPRLAVDLRSRLEAAGLRPDGLTYTTLVQAYGRLGQVAAAAATFEALLADRSAAVDVRAYNALVDAFARNGDMEAAERMLSAAADLADSKGQPPPVEGFGAVVAGYSRQLAVAPAVAAVRRFHAAGGQPDAQMLDILANIGIRTGDYRVAMQAVRALELIGRDVDKSKYAALLEEVRARAAAEGRDDPDRPQHNRTWAAYQRRLDARRKNVQLERLKWLLGLPNSYYSDSEPEAGGPDEWQDDRRL